MAAYPDLSECDYLPEMAGLGFVAIGWLEPGHNYATGEVDEPFFDKLCALLAKPWKTPVACGGIHPCGLCRFTGGGTAHRNGIPITARSSGFLFVPFQETAFVSPQNIAHYVDTHGYCPPTIFRQAVMSCPKTDSMDFKQALLKTPVKKWLERVSAPTSHANHA